jgi:uncharacterized protein
METQRQKYQVAFAGLCVGLGLVLLGLFIKSGITSFKAMDRIVAVKGLSEKEVVADRVIWPLMYKEVGDDLQAVNAAIVDFLKANGLTEDEITLSAPEIIDMEAERYVSQGVRYRYNATSVVTVFSTQVDKVRLLMQDQRELLNKGIALSGDDYRFQKQFLFTGLNTIKPEMIEEATQNARAAAEKFAKDSNSKLGKIRSADQGQFSINDRDANTPYIKTVRVVTTINYFLED